MSNEGTEIDEETRRARALALLEATHQFPCHYALTVIAFNRDDVTDALQEAVRLKATADADGERERDDDLDDAIATYESRASGGGKYLSHRFAVRVVHAGEVLELYARVRAVDGVVTLL